MEYQQKKEQILGAVEFTSLLSFNLVENKLERNFRAIVEALLLGQTRNDDLAAKVDQLDDRQALDRQKTAQDTDVFRQALKQVSERVAKLENGQQSAPGKLPRSDSSKQIREPDRNDSVRREPHPSEHTAPAEKNSFLEKKMEDAFHEIAALKEKMPTLKLMEGELENMKRDLTAIRAELMTVGKSSKSIKRESINPARGAFKRESSSKTPKAALTHSSSSVLLQEVDKENRSQHVEAKEGNRVETNASNVVSGGEEVDRELEGLHIEVNTLNLCFEELKGQVEDLRKKDIRYHSTMAELEDRHRRMQDQMRKDSESFEKALKGVQLDIMGLGSQTQSESAKPSKEHEQESKEGRDGKRQVGSGNIPGSSNSSRQGEENSVNFKNQLNDKLNKLQNSLNGFISEGEFNRFKTETRGKLEEGERKHEKLVNEFQEEIRKIYDMFINKDVDLSRLNQLVAANAETARENHSQAQRKHNIAIARVEELKKNLQNLREDVEFYQAMNTENKEAKAKSEEKREVGEGRVQHGGSGVDPKALEDLKKYFNNKLHDQRAYLVGLIRDLEKKQNSASAVNQEIANLWDKANELATFLGKKGDAQDIKKSLVYLEKKINKIGAQLVKAEDNTEDARIARTNWFCLSCDKNLLGYQGKPGKHMVWDSMPLKGVVKTVDKKGLPSLKK